MKTWKEDNMLSLTEGLFTRKESLNVSDFNGTLDYNEIAEYKDFYGIAYYNKTGEDTYTLRSLPALFPKKLAKELSEKLNDRLKEISYPKMYLSFVVSEEDDSEIRNISRPKYFYTVRKSNVSTKTASEYTVKELMDGDKNILGFFEDIDDVIEFVNTLKSYRGKKLNVCLDYTEEGREDWDFIGIEGLYDYDTKKKKEIYSHTLSFIEKLINDDNEFRKHFVGITSYYKEQ